MSKKDFRKEAKALIDSRIKAIKQILKSKPNWRAKVFQKYPEYDTASGGQHLTNFLSLRANSDIILLERLEEMVASWPEDEPEPVEVKKSPLGKAIDDLLGSKPKKK